MARAFPQSQPLDDERDGGDWQSLRQELMVLLDQVDSQVARNRRAANQGAHPPLDSEPPGPDLRHKDALRTVQRQLSRFEEPGHAMPPNPRDSLQAAISQIRSRQNDNRPERAPAPPPQPAPVPRENSAVLEKLAQSVNGISGRLERLEGEIRAQLKSGTDVKDVADQVAQLAHVVELLAGAVGETGQVKRLEGQIASLGRLMAQGRDTDVAALTRRLDDVAGTIGKLAELQVHYADKVENPVASQAFKQGMQAIEENVRNVYDRIDALERNSSLTPRDLEHVTAQMARFTEAVREHSGAPSGLVELIDALNQRIAEIENGDRLLYGLRKDLVTLRESVVASLQPRFDAIEHRMDGLSTRDDMEAIGRQIGALGTREDMAEIGRQIGMLSARMDQAPADAGIGQLEAQVRQLVARMDQTGEQLVGLARLYNEPAPAALPDFDAMAEMVAERTAAAVGRTGHQSLDDTLTALEQRISAMIQDLPRNPEMGSFDGMQAGISEVNERLKKLETSLSARTAATSAPPPAPMQSRIDAILGEAERSASRPWDNMPRGPSEDAPLFAPTYPDPAGPVQQALDSKVSRKLHPGLEDDVPLAARYDAPQKQATRADLPAAPKPSIDFSAPAPEMVDDPHDVSSASTNTFIAAARRAAQRQTHGGAPAPAVNSLIGRALSRFHTTHSEAAISADPAPKAAKAQKTPAAVLPPVVEPVVPHVDEEAPEAKESFLLRHRKAILYAAAAAAIALLTVNLIVRLNTPADDTPVAATATPATTGDIGAPADAGGTASLAQPIPPRVIADVGSTSGSTSGVSPAFTNSPLPEMASTFSAPASDTAASTDAGQDPVAGDTDPSQVANIDPSMATLPDTAAIPGASATPAPLATDATAAGTDTLPDKLGPIELRQAAIGGDPRAQFEVAASFTEGRVVPQDYAAAGIWYQRAAAQGFAPAEYRLGSMYESGKGVTKDLQQAELWYEKAAEAGNRMSMHNLASLYAGGQMGTQQFDKAAQWFEKAANLGLVDSQFNLGMLYARGLGVTQSLQDSFKWFGIAALSGDKDSAKARDDIARSLDAATVTRLTAEVNAFKPGAIDIAANFAPIGTWSQKFDPGQTIDSHDIVLSVQKALGKLGYDVGTPDGVAGKKTADAIKSFEGATGMSQVGAVNPRLLAVLGSQPV